MKVICINDFNHLRNIKINGITYGKVYDVIYIGYTFYNIINDYNLEDNYSSYMFEDLSLYRNRIIDKILDE